MSTQAIPFLFSDSAECRLYIGLWCALVLFAGASSLIARIASKRKRLPDEDDDSLGLRSFSAGEAALTDTSSSTTGEGKVAASAEDLELLKSVDEAVYLGQYQVAGRLLRRVSDQSLLTKKHREWLEMSAQSEHVMEDLLTPRPEESGWSKLSEAHGHRDTLIYYRIDEQYRLTCRIETPIEESMLVPLLAVCNETDIFHAAGESVMVKDFGRGNQISQVVFATPFPFANREMYQYAFACDEIDESAAIIVKIRSLDPGTYDGATVPEPGKLIRVDYDSGILIRSCPEDHPTLQHSRGEYPPNEKLLLLSATSSFDAHIHFVPLRLINYATRIMIGYVWGSLLKTSEEVRAGKRPAHTEAIRRNPELYGWVEERIKVMLAKLEQEQEESGEKEEETVQVEDGKTEKSRKRKRRFRNPFRKGRGRKRKGKQEGAVPELKPATPESNGHHHQGEFS